MKTGAKILLMTDFSEVAGYATFFAKEIAKKVQGTVEVMHILTTPVDWVNLEKEKEQFYPETLQEIATANAKLFALVGEFEHLGILATSSLVYSYGSETVFEHVINSKPDMVIMGSEGRGSRKPFYMGSYAQKMLRNIKIPLLIVKDAPIRPEIKKIAFLTTLEENQKPVLKKLQILSSLLGAQIDLIFVNTPYNFYEDQESDERFEDMKDGDSSIQQFLTNAENPENGVMYYAERNHPDILVLAKSEKSGITKFFTPSLTENLVRAHNFPILSICLE
ncbi:universal stress protein [Algoriphagus limi]|uniref:Universal stress protein n=1 Tax=Algoriphagus limi TaxID=2975273 RepID=A0ABT2G7F7_9BACT|nr:universal stress protein [Algoriphagus limi]MCS5490703.1 universal stress protein [Algoriphagus limi]